MSIEAPLIQRADGMAKPTRLEKAIELRDAALTVIQTKGSREVLLTPDGRVSPLEIAPGHIIYASFDGPDMHGILSFQGELMGIDIWAVLNGKRTKVFNVTWDKKGGAVDLRAFKRGDWEQELLAMAGRGPLH